MHKGAIPYRGCAFMASMGLLPNTCSFAFSPLMDVGVIMFV